MLLRRHKKAKEVEFKQEVDKKETKKNSKKKKAE